MRNRALSMPMTVAATRLSASSALCGERKSIRKSVQKQMTNRIHRSLLVASLAIASLMALPRPLQASDSFTVTAPLSANVLSGCTEVTLSGQVSVDSAGLTTTAATNAGNVLSNGNVTLTGQATGTGSATAGPG